MFTIILQNNKILQKYPNCKWLLSNCYKFISRKLIFPQLMLLSVDVYHYLVMHATGAKDELCIPCYHYLRSAFIKLFKQKKIKNYVLRVTYLYSIFIQRFINFLKLFIKFLLFWSILFTILERKLYPKNYYTWNCLNGQTEMSYVYTKRNFGEVQLTYSK